MQLPDGPVTVRLRNIDAPELNQPGGGAATRALHKRLLAQEKEGHAWAYRGHTRESDYCVWENAAR